MLGLGKIACVEVAIAIVSLPLHMRLGLGKTKRLEWVIEFGCNV